ncbi:MAG: hypothetical protein Q9214_004926 [Letrouitia sp. 1 TL-2023]
MGLRKLSKEPVDKVYGVLAILPSQMRDQIRDTAGVLPGHSDEMGPSIITIGPDTSSLQMRGMLMDSVKSTIPLAWTYIDAAQYDPRSAVKAVECEEACLRLSKQIYGAQEKVPIQHMTTLVAGMTTMRSHYPMDQLCAGYELATQQFRDFCKQPSDRQGTQSTADKIATDRYKGAMKITWRHANFFTMTNGTIGIGLETVEPGDDICIIFAAHTPFILRKNAGKETYAFHGEAYVHGLMDGGAFAAKDPVRNVQDFVIQ